MPLYEDPQGQKFNVPDNPSPEEAQQIRVMKLRPAGGDGQLKDLLKSIFSGGAEGIARAPLIGGDLIKLAMHGGNALQGNKDMPLFSKEHMDQYGSQPWIDAFKGSDEDKTLRGAGADLTYEPQTTAGRYAKAGTSAVTGAATTGGLGAFRGLGPAVEGINAAKVALTPGSMMVNGGAGVASEFGYDATRQFDETKQGNPLVALLAGATTSGVGNLVRAARTPNLDKDIYNATKTMSPDEWKASKESLHDFAASGSKSYTLADLPKLQPRIGGLAQSMSNTTGGNLLQQKLGTDARMNEDIPRMLSEIPGMSGAGNYDPRELAKALAEKANTKITDAVKTRSGALEGSLRAAGNVPAPDLLAAANPIRLAGTDAGNQSYGMKRSLADAEAALLGPDARKTVMTSQINPPILNVRSLSQNVKALRNIPATSTDNPSRAVSSAQRMAGADMADDALRRASSGYSQAMTNYGDFNENVLGPLERGATGALREVTDGKGIVNKLRGVPPDRLVQELNTLGISQQEAQQIAHLVGQGLDPLPNLVKASDNAKLDRKMFLSLLDSMNPDVAAQAGKKLGVVDQLSKLHAEHGTDRTVMNTAGSNWGSTVVNAFNETGRRLRAGKMEKEASRLSDILANPTAENLDRLRKLSEIDPRARRALNWVSSLVGASTNTGVNKAEE